jgi:hypothetical protein
MSPLCCSSTITTSATKNLHHGTSSSSSHPLAKIRRMQTIEHNMPNGNKRYISGSKSSFKKTTNKVEDATSRTPQQEAKLKWTEREQAPWWLQKMAPYKGGTKLPNKLEATVLSIVIVLGYYAWFVDSGSWFVISKSRNDVIAPGAGAGDSDSILIETEASQER